MREDDLGGACAQQTANRGKGLRISENALALLRVLEKLREPGHGSDKFNADADESGAAQNEKHRWRRAEPGRKGRKGVQKNAPNQNTAAPETVRQISSDQAEESPRQSGNVKEEAKPVVKLG